MESDEEDTDPITNTLFEMSKLAKLLYKKTTGRRRARTEPA